MKANPRKKFKVVEERFRRWRKKHGCHVSPECQMLFFIDYMAKTNVWTMDWECWLADGLYYQHHGVKAITDDHQASGGVT